MKRLDNRADDELRKIHFTKNFLAHPLSSVLVEVGGTRVICSVSVENKVPPWMKQQRVPGGWLTCEYGMLPSATHDRTRREASAGKQSGRTMEIQRLIGRSLRSVVDLLAIGENTIYIDCDVIDADGGTRCAGITGAALALALALESPEGKRLFPGKVLKERIAAVSVGMVEGRPVLDLNYAEDSSAEVDMNVIMTESGKFVEIQGTAEENPFSREELNQLLGLAEKGLRELFDAQASLLAPQKSEKTSEPNKPRRLPLNVELGSLGALLDQAQK